MFERLKIKYLGNQPIAEISKETLEKLIQRDFPESYEIVKKKLSLIKSDSLKGQNRLSAAVLKVSNANLSKIDSYIEMCNSDYRDVISQAEYPRISEIGFVGIKEIEPSLLKEHYLKDWTEYTNWMNK
jgi:hypothetical protein